MIDGIQCDYMFWDDKPSFSSEDKEQEKQWELTYRTPKDRDFRPGEFEELCKQLPTFKYYFEQGFTPLDPVIMDNIVQAINEKHPEFDLKLKNFEVTGTPHATFTILHKEAIEEAERHIKTDYESRMAALEGKHEQMMQLMSAIVSKPQVLEVIFGDKVGGDLIKTAIETLQIKGERPQLAIGKDLEQKQEERSISPGRDYVEQVEGDLTTGNNRQEED